MAADRSAKRSAAQERLRGGFLAQLDAELVSLAELLGEGEDARDTVSAELQRLAQTAGALGLNDLATYKAFEERVIASREAFIAFLQKAKAEGKRVVALGASTKGNVVLQYCGVSEDLIEAVGEVNPDKFGAVTPGTHLPIQDEAKVLAQTPDYAVVLPWHFRKFFEEQDRYSNLNLVYPLPVLEIRPGK